jgi:serine/threonine protein kinase
MDNYNVIELVGEGSFGKVYKARRRFTGQIVVRAVPSPPLRPPAAASPAAPPAALTLPARAAGHQVHPQARQK